MQTNELRIGNWVIVTIEKNNYIEKPSWRVLNPELYDNFQVKKWKEKQITKIESIYEDKINIYTEPYDETIYGYDDSEFEPIPLTPAVLGACGFTTESEDYFSLNGFTIANTGNVSYNGEERECFISAPNNIWLKYLHQLQNLYFAQTQHELSINLNALQNANFV